MYYQESKGFLYSSSLLSLSAHLNDYCIMISGNKIGTSYFAFFVFSERTNYLLEKPKSSAAHFVFQCSYFICETAVFLFCYDMFLTLLRLISFLPAADD